MKKSKQTNSYFSFIAKLFVMVCIAITACTTLANGSNLCTKTGQSISIGISDYTYKEPQVMSLEANKLGFTWTKIQTFGHNSSCLTNGWFLNGQIHLANGKAVYLSPISGTLYDTPNWYVRSNLLVGKDYFIGDNVLSPHTGLGFRYLHNDLRTNDFRQGYRRDNFLAYVPIGITHTTAILNGYKLSTTIEYNHLIKGIQKSKLSDQNIIAENINLSQSKGQGFRFEIMLSKNDFSFGPSVNYWKVERSNDNKKYGIYEPQNYTTEIQLKITKHFN